MSKNSRRVKTDEPKAELKNTSKWQSDRCYPKLNRLRLEVGPGQSMIVELICHDQSRASKPMPVLNDVMKLA